MSEKEPKITYLNRVGTDQRRVPPNGSRGFARFNFVHNTEKMRGFDIDYVVESKTDGVDLILIESKNPVERHRIGPTRGMAKLVNNSVGRIRAYIYRSERGTWDERAESEIDDWDAIQILEVVEQDHRNVERGIILVDELDMANHEKKLLAEGRIPYDSKLTRRRMQIDFSEHEA